MALSVRIEKQVCVGSGKCVGYQPLAFGFDTDDSSMVMDTIDRVPDEQLRQAARLCPVSAIHLYDAAGRLVIPEA